MPIDWSKSLVFKCHKESLGITADNSSEKSDCYSTDLLLSDAELNNTDQDIDDADDYNNDDDDDDETDEVEEELREQLDMHSMIISKNVNDEPLFTAEQVLSEIECMMQQVLFN